MQTETVVADVAIGRAMIVNIDELLAGAAWLGIAGALLAPEIRGWRKGSSNANPRKRALADFLPYRRLVRSDVIWNASGSYTAAWRIAGSDVGTLADGDVLNTAYQIAATLGSLPPGSVAQLYARRKSFREYDRGRGLDHPVIETLDGLREDFFLKRERVYFTERTFALTWQPPAAMLERMRAASSAVSGSRVRTENELLAEFEALCERAESALSIRTLRLTRLGARRELDMQGIDRNRSDLLAFVASCLTGSDAPLNVPPETENLNTFLAVEGRGGYEVKIGDLEVGAIELKSYPDGAEPLMLRKLAELNLPHSLCVRFMPMAVAEARKNLKGAAVDYKGAAGFNRGIVDPAAEQAAEQMVTAFGKASGDYTRFGQTNIVLLVRGRTRAAVTRAQREVIAVLEAAGFRAAIRSMGALDSVLSTLPGQAKYGVRKHPLDALTIAKLFPIHESDLGRRWSESESHTKRVPAVTYALGPGSTFFRMHLNVSDVYHGFTLGKTGSGKSVQASYLAAMFRGRTPLAGVTTIDRGRSSYQLCRFLDGEFYDLLGPQSPGFALFADVEDPEAQRDVLGILEEMCELNGVRVTPERQESLRTAIRLMAAMPAQRRSLFAYYEILQDSDHVLRPVIKKYTRLGDLGTLLDCSEDTFRSGRFNVVDVNRLTGMAPAYLVPIYRTLFWKTQSHIRAMKRDLGPSYHHLVNVDEAHTLVGDAIGGRFILDILKTGRKENIGVWLSSNSPRDFANFDHRSDLLLQCASRIYFGDSGATADDPETVEVYKNLQLPMRGIAALPNMADRTMLLHQPEANVLKELSLRLDRDVLAIVGTSRTSGMVDEYIGRYGLHGWKLPFLRAQGAVNAAAQLEAVLQRDLEAREALTA